MGRFRLQPLGQQVMVFFLGRFLTCSCDFGLKLLVSNSFAESNSLLTFAFAGLSDICSIEDMV